MDIDRGSWPGIVLAIDDDPICGRKPFVDDLHILYFLSELDIPVVCFPVAINDDDVGADNVLSHCFAADQQLGAARDRDANLYELSSDQDPMALLGLRIGKDPADLKGSGITGELVVVVVDVSLVGIFLLIHSQSQFDRNLFRFDRRTLSFADRFFDLFDRTRTSGPQKQLL